MAAILGLDDEKIATPVSAGPAGGWCRVVVEPVNFNGPWADGHRRQQAAVERACEAARRVGAKRAVLLPVSAPFHSSLIRPAAAGWRPVSANSALQVAALAGDQQRRRRRRVRSGADQGGARSTGPFAGALGRNDPPNGGMGITTVAECGPGKVLAGLTKRCADGLTSVALADLASLDGALANLE
jgi:[acyl-carrier-protein] S-malonyltransferase